MEQAYKAAQNSEGVGDYQLSVYKDTIEAYLQEFKNSITEITTLSLDSSMIKHVVTIMTTIADFVKKLGDFNLGKIGELGQLPVILGSIFGVLRQKQGRGLFAYNKATGQYQYTGGLLRRTRVGVSNIWGALRGGNKASMAEISDWMNTNAPDANMSLYDAFSLGTATTESAFEGAPQALRDYIKTLDETALKTMTVAQATKKAQAQFNTFARVGMKLTNVFSGFISTIGSMIVGMAASFVLSKAMEGIGHLMDLFSGKIRRERAQESIDKVNEIEQKMKDTETTVNDNKDRYLELYSGVSIDNNHINNVSLANDEYQEFLDINQKLLEVLPSLQTGFDAQGQAIADLGDNAEEAGEKIQDALDYELYKEAQEVKGKLDAQLTNNTSEQESIEKEIKQLQSQVDDYNKIADIINGTSDIYKQTEDIKIGPGLEGNQYREKTLLAFEDALYNQDIDYDKDQMTGELIVPSITDDQMETVRKQVMDSLEDIQTEASQAALDIPNKQKDIKSQWKEYAEGMVTVARQDASYKELGAALGDQFGESFDTALYNMDWYKTYYEAWNDSSDVEWEDFVSKEMLAPMLEALNNGTVTKVNLLDMFTLNASGKTNKEFRDQMDSTIDAIFGDNEELKQVFRIAIGYTYLDENGQEHELQTLRRDQIFKALGGTIDENGKHISGKIKFDDINTLKYEQQMAIMKGIEDKSFKPEKIETFQDLLDWITEYNKKVPEMEQMKLSDVLGTEDFDKQTKTYVSNFSSINSAIDEYLENGKMADKTKMDLENLFPDLTKFDTDDPTFFKALLDKRLEYAQEYMDKLYDILNYEYLSDEDQKAAQNYFRTTISGFDIKGANEQQAKTLIANNIFGEKKYYHSSDAQADIEKYQNTLSAFGPDTDWNIVANLAVDPTSATWTIEDWINKYKDLKIKASLDLDDQIKESRIEAYKSTVSTSQAAGIQVNDEAYKQLVTDYEDTTAKAEEKYDYADKELKKALANGEPGEAAVDAAVMSYNEALTEYNNAYAEEIAMKKEATENQTVSLNNNIQDYQNQTQQLDRLVTQNQKERKRTSQQTFDELQALSNNEAYAYDSIAQIYTDAAENTKIPALKAFFTEQALSAQGNAIEARDKANQYSYGVNTENLSYLGDELTALKADAQEINDLISLKQAKGLKVTEKEYKDLVNISKRQIQNLQAQNKELEEAKKKTSDYKEQLDFQSQIDANNSAIMSTLADIEGYNKTMDDLVVSNAKSLASAISSAISESLSGTGLETETINSLVSGFSDLGDAADLSSVFYGTADGVKVDLVALQRLAQQQNQIINQGFESKMNEISDAIERASKAGDTSGLKAAQDELAKLQRQQSQYFATYEEQMKQFNRMSQIEFADQTDNAGKNYESAKAYLESAKEMWDKGLIGTDDFKARAAYFDPYGLTDADTFLENYNRKSKYYTEDHTGVKAFLDDLVAKQLATYNEMEGYTLDFVDFTSAALAMGFSDEEFTDMLDRTVDYGFSIQHVSSLEEAALKASDLRAQLTQAELEYAHLIETGASEDILAKKNEEINGLKNEMTLLDEATAKYTQNSQKEFIEGFQNLPETVDYLKQAYAEAESAGDASGMQRIRDQLESLAETYGVKINFENFEIDSESYDAVSKEIGTNLGERLKQQLQEQMRTRIEQGQRTPGADLSQITQEGQASIDMVDRLIPELEKADSKVHGIISTIQSSDKDMLGQIVFGDRKLAEGEAGQLETMLDGLIADLGLSQDEGNLLLQVLMQLAGMETDVSVDTSTEQLDEMNDKIQQGTKNLKKLQANGKVDISFNMDQDPSQITDLSTLQNNRQQLVDAKLGFSVDSDEYAAIQHMIDQYDAQIADVQIKVELEGADNAQERLEQLRAMTDEQLAETFSIDLEDDDAEQKIAALRQSLEGMTAAVTVRIADDQMQSLTANQNGGETTMTILGDNTKAKESADEAEKYASDKKPEMSIGANGSPAITTASFTAHTISTMNPTITISANTSVITETLNRIMDRQYTIRVAARVSGLPQGQTTPAASGTMIARSNGSAYNVINYKPLDSYAKGSQVALGRNEDALTNEIGQESVVFLMPHYMVTYREINLFNCWELLRVSQTTT